MPNFSRGRALGAASSLLFVVPALRSVASAAPRGDDAADVATLNTALPVARAAVKAYADAAATNALSPTVADVLKGFGGDHQAHVDAIAAAITQLGGTPSTSVGSDGIGTAKSEADILDAAYTVERGVAAAYLAALASLHKNDIAHNTGAMLGVVTTHVALLAEALRKGRPYPTGFVTA